jgi:hypothetical protein
MTRWVDTAHTLTTLAPERNLTTSLAQRVATHGDDPALSTSQSDNNLIYQSVKIHHFTQSSHTSGDNRGSGVLAEPMEEFVTFRDDVRRLSVRGQRKVSLGLPNARESLKVNAAFLTASDTNRAQG